MAHADEIELTPEDASTFCPYCGTAHLFPADSKITVFTCKQCGETVEICDDLEQFFGKE